MSVLGDSIVSGLETSAFLATATVGFSLTLWLDNFFNVAQAEFLMIAAFSTYYLEVDSHLPFAAAAVVAVVATAVVAVAVNALVYNPMRNQGRVVLLISALGVFYAIQGIIGSIVPPGVYSLNLPNPGQVVIWGTAVPWLTIGSILTAVLLLGFVHLFLGHTRPGLQARALADQRDLALVRGVDERRASTAVWVVVGVTAGIAGLMLGISGTLNTGLGTEQMLFIVSVAIMAGTRSVVGVGVIAVVGGLVLNVVGAYLQTADAEAILFAMMIVVLVVRPRGIFGIQVHRREV